MSLKFKLYCLRTNNSFFSLLGDKKNFKFEGNLMSLKTHLIFNPFFLVYYKIIVDSYTKTWVICSNLILQKNTAEVKIPAKTGRIQPENKKKEVATRK